MTTIMEEVKNGLVFGPRRMEGKGGDSVQVGSADLNSIYLSMRHARHTPAPSRPLQTDWTGLDKTGQGWPTFELYEQGSSMDISTIHRRRKRVREGWILIVSTC
jgi:hypothetical protein